MDTREELRKLVEEMRDVVNSHRSVGVSYTLVGIWLGSLESLLAAQQPVGDGKVISHNSIPWEDRENKIRTVVATPPVQGAETGTPLKRGSKVLLQGEVEKIREDGTVLIHVAGKWNDQFVLVDPSALASDAGQGR